MRKRVGRPMNEMKKRQDEVPEFNYQNDDDDEDLSQYWSDYDTWGYDKRSAAGLHRNMKKFGRMMILQKRKPFLIKNF